MDPLTLFALANGAVAAVKKGCQLYKDIKGAAGDVKSVLKDLDEQFSAAHKDRPPTVAQKNAYVEEKNRVIELNKKKGETDDIYLEIGNKLSEYFDAYNKCKAVLEEEERNSKHTLYTGDDSLAKRAIQRVMMNKKLEQMRIDLRELLVYQCPPELGALYTDINAMMETVGQEQAIHIKKKMQEDAVIAKRRASRMRALKADLYLGIILFISSIAFGFIIALIIEDRIKRYPELGVSIIPRVSDEYKIARDREKKRKILEMMERHRQEIEIPD